jgi:hypothetical protein
MDMTHRFTPGPSSPPLCGYSERAYFPDPVTGRRDHCAHCAARDEHLRLKRAHRAAVQAFERRRNGRWGR